MNQSVSSNHNIQSEQICFDSKRVGSEVKDWITLLKPRVISLVVFTGIVGTLLAPHSLNPLVVLISILCICMASGGAGAINMWYDQDIDRIMKRTATRPLPGKRIEAHDALIYGICVCVISVILMYLATNVLAAFILAFSIFFYTVIYTICLKRSTPQNIVIGGAAGAFPPLIGWIAVTGSLSLFPVILFAIIFLWTPPHFWSLSLYACKDYGRAGIPMLPVVKGPRYTRWQILIYTLILTVVALAPAYLHYTGYIYTVSAVILNIGFVCQAVRVLREKQDQQGYSLIGDKAARNAFHYSLLYLFFLFLALLVDHFF